MRLRQLRVIVLLLTCGFLTGSLEGQPIPVGDSVQLAVGNSRSSLDRASGIIETSFDLTLTNTGEIDIEAPLHVAMTLNGDYLPGTAGFIEAMGGDGSGPYGTWYFDLSPEIGAALEQGQSLVVPIRYYRPSDISVSYGIEVYGVVNSMPELAELPQFQGVVGEPLTLSGVFVTDPDGDPLFYNWTTSTGQSSTEPAPTFQFDIPGIHEVVLEVSDDREGLLTTRFTVTILPSGDKANGRTRTLDGTGLPLDSVTVEEYFAGREPITYLSDEESGFTSLGSTSGFYLWKFSKAGYLSVWRAGELVSGKVTAVPNPWLKEVESTPHSLSVLGVTEITDAGESIRLIFPEGSFEQTGNAFLTRLNSQSLPYPLPAGWSPLQAFHFASDSPPITSGSVEATLIDETLAGETVVLVSFDEGSAAWITESIASGTGSSVFTGSIEAPGTYAVVVPDSGPNAPSEAVPSEALPSSPMVEIDSNLLTVTGEVVPGSVIASVIPSEVTVSGQLSVNADSLPTSGFWLSGRIDEVYTLLDGRDIRTPDYDSTLFSYSRPAGVEGGMSIQLPLRPQLLFPPEDLFEARIRMDVFGSVQAEGTILDTEGGILARDGVRIVAPAGLLGQATTAEILSSRIESFISVAPRAIPVKAFQVNLSGLDGTQALEISFEPLSPNVEYVLARLVIGGGDFGLQPVERFSSDENGILASSEPVSGPRLPGLVRAGQYVLLQVPEALGLIEGIVSGNESQPLEGVSIRVDNTPWGGVTGPGGTYQMLSPAGGFTLFAYDPQTGEEGRADGELANPTDSLQLDFTAALVGPRVASVSPTDNASEVSEVAPVVLRFSKALDPASFGPAAVSVLTVDGGELVSGSLGLNLNATEATFLPANPFERDTAYRIVLAATIRDLNGLPIEGSLEFSFTTRPPEARALGAQLVIYEPGAAIIPPEVLDQLVGYEPGGSLVVAHGSSGTADPEVPVILVNETTGETATVLSNPDGSFANFIYADEADFISAVFVNQNGTRITVPATKQLFDDGRQGLYRYGGILEAQSDGGPVQVLVEPEAINNRSVFKMEPLGVDELLALTGGVEPVGEAELIGGVRISTEGDELQQSAKVRIPVTLQQLGLTPEDDPNDGSFALTVPREVDGVQVYEIIDKVVYENGYLTTTSPPFAGYTADDTRQVMAMARMSFGNAAVIVGRVTSATNPDAPASSDLRAVPGAVVFSTETAIVGTQNKVVAGAFVAIAETSGRFSLIVPTSSFSPSGTNSAVTLAAGSGRFPNQVVAGFATLVDPESVSILTASGLIFKRTTASGFVGDDRSPPQVTFSQSVYDPDPGEYFSFEFLASDDRTVPTFTASVVNAIPLNNGPQVFPADITFDFESNVIVGTSRRVRYRVRCTKPASILISFTATDGSGNVTTGYASPNITASDAPPPVAPDPNDVEGPFVLNSRPITGAQFVSPFEPIELQFSEPIDPAFINTADQVFVLSPDAGKPYFSQSEDGKTITFQYPKLKPNQGYSFYINTGPSGFLRDPAGNPFDQIPGGFQDFFSLTFTTEPVLFETNLAVERGVGAAGNREWAFLLDRRDGIKPGIVHIYGRNPDDSINLDSIKIDLGLPYPRDLFLIEDYDYYIPETSISDDLLLDRDLLVVIGGSVAVPALSGTISQTDIPWLKVYDVTDPTKPEEVAYIPVRSAIGNALVKMEWSPPLLGVMELGAEGVHINLLNLQLLLYSEKLTPYLLTFQPEAPVAGTDLNADGDYADAGDVFPKPSSVLPQLGWINNGLVGSINLPDDDSRRIMDFSMVQGGALVGAVLRSTPGTPYYKTLVSGGTPTDPGQGELALDVDPRRILIVMGVPVSLGGTDVQIVNLAFVTRSGQSNLRVIDITDPVNPTLFADVEVSDTESETLFTPMLAPPAPDGSIRIVVASESNLYIIDPTKIKLSTSGTTRPYITGFLPNGGTPTRRFLTDGAAFYAVASWDRNRIVTDKPTDPVFTTSNPTLIDTNSKKVGNNTVIIERKSKDNLLEIVAKDPTDIKGKIDVSPSGVQLPEDYPSWYAEDHVGAEKAQTGLNSLYRFPGISNPIESTLTAANSAVTLTTVFNWVPEFHDVDVDTHLLKLNVYPAGSLKFGVSPDKITELYNKLKAAESTLRAVGTAANPGPFAFDITIEKPKGSFSASLSYAECDNTSDPSAQLHLVFVKVEAEPKFDPLFGVKGKFSIKPPLPGIITSFLGKAEVFVEAGGSVSISGKLGLDQCGFPIIEAPISGKVSLSIGASIAAIPVTPSTPTQSGTQEYLLSLTAKASAEVTINFNPALSQSSGLQATYKADYSGVKGTLEAKAMWGNLTWKNEVTFIQGGNLIPETTTVLID
ncbi:MAG: Ig-like domain-containing protein [Puniceicoccaceae bacterium]